MKRRSFLALVLAALGIKFVPREEPTWEEIFDTTYHEWPQENRELIDIRMDQAGEFARDQLAKELWDTTRGHWEL